MGSCKMCTLVRQWIQLSFHHKRSMVLYSLHTKYHPFNNIDSGAEFILNATGSIACITKNLWFLILFLMTKINFILNDKDLDPDINYWNNITLPDCNYVTSSDLNALRSEHKDYNKFPILHSNCRSIFMKNLTVYCPWLIYLIIIFM